MSVIPMFLGRVRNIERVSQEACGPDILVYCSTIQQRGPASGRVEGKDLHFKMLPDLHKVRFPMWILGIFRLGCSFLIH